MFELRSSRLCPRRRSWIDEGCYSPSSPFSSRPLTAASFSPVHSYVVSPVSRSSSWERLYAFFLRRHLHLSFLCWTLSRRMSKASSMVTTCPLPRRRRISTPGYLLASVSERPSFSSSFNVRGGCVVTLFQCV